MKKLVHVAVGVIFDGSPTTSKKILIAKRADHQHQGGLWEFPGGKVEVGESVQIALQRELQEELDLTVSIDDMRPLITIPFHYSDKSVLLDVWSVYGGEMPNIKNAEGELIGKEGQPLLWINQAELTDYEFPKANKAIIDALLLPNKIAISQDNSDPETILMKVAKTLHQHSCEESFSEKKSTIWIQLRAPSLDQMQYTQLAMKLYGICHEAGSQLIWNCPFEWYQVAFADGLHLSNKNFNAVRMSKDERLIPTSQWLSTACHNLAEVEVAQELVDYVLVSPVHETKTHPRGNALTWSGFKVITDIARIPCYALGGLKPSEFENCIQLGGQGIAGIRCFLVEEKNMIENNIKEKEYES